MAGTTAVKHLRYPTGGDAPSFAVDMKNLADDTDAQLVVLTELIAQYRKINPATLTTSFATVPFGTSDGTNTLTGYASPTFTAPAAGIYEFTVGLMFGATAPTVGVAMIQAALFVNGAQRYTVETLATAVLISIAIPTVRLNLSAGDTVDVRATASSGTVTVTTPNGYENWLLIKKIG